MFAAGTVMKAVFLSVDALETTATMFRVGVYQTGRQQTHRRVVPTHMRHDCALFHIVFRVAMTERPA